MGKESCRKELDIVRFVLSFLGHRSKVSLSGACQGIKCSAVRLHSGEVKKIKIKIKKDLESPTGKRTGHGHGTQNITVNNTQTPWAAHGIAPLAACFWKKSVLLWGERPHPCPVWA